MTLMYIMYLTKIKKGSKILIRILKFRYDKIFELINKKSSHFLM